MVTFPITSNSTRLSLNTDSRDPYNRHKNKEQLINTKTKRFFTRGEEEEKSLTIIILTHALSLVSILTHVHFPRYMYEISKAHVEYLAVKIGMVGLLSPFPCLHKIKFSALIQITYLLFQLYIKIRSTNNYIPTNAVPEQQNFNPST